MSLSPSPPSLFRFRPPPSRSPILETAAVRCGGCCGEISDDHILPAEVLRRAVNPSRGPFTSRGTVHARNQTAAYRDCSDWSLIPSPSSRLTIPRRAYSLFELTPRADCPNLTTQPRQLARLVSPKAPSADVAERSFRARYRFRGNNRPD